MAFPPPTIANHRLSNSSDTTAATLTSMFFHLASDRTLCEKLQAELDALPDLSYDSLRGAKLLEAVINETLRLHPAVPSGTQRKSPPEGMTIGNTYIPGDVFLCVPLHTLFRGIDTFLIGSPTLGTIWPRLKS